MLEDDNPCSYEYDDLARVLSHLGFAEAPNAGSSHRKWRLRLPGPRTIIIGLVKGRGPLRKEYVLDMIATLRSNDLLPLE